MKEKIQRRFDSFTFLTIVFIILVVIAGVVVYLQAQEAHYILKQAKWYYVIAGTAISFLSFFFLSIAYVLVAWIFSIEIHKKEIFYISAVTIPVGTLLDVGGIGGNSIRVAYLRKIGIKDTHSLILSSFFFTYCVFIGILIFVPIGFLWLFLENLLTPELKSVAKLILEISIGTLFAATIILFISRVREHMLLGFSKIIYYVTRREIYHHLEPIHRALLIGTNGFLEKPKVSFQIFLNVFLSRALALFVLWLCFVALGVHAQFGVLVVGFSLGILAGLFTPIPGGIGVQDTSMAGIFALSGIPLDYAIFISILFRIVYDIIPTGVGLLGYYILIERLKRKTNNDAVIQ